MSAVFSRRLWGEQKQTPQDVCGEATNQKHYPDLVSDASSVWNFCARFSDVISRGNWCGWCREMSDDFSGWGLKSFAHHYFPYVFGCIYIIV